MEKIKKFTVEEIFYLVNHPQKIADILNQMIDKINELDEKVNV